MQFDKTVVKDVIKTMKAISNFERDSSVLMTLKYKYNLDHADLMSIWKQYKQEQKQLYKNAKVTKDDILMLSALTGYLFVEDFQEVVSYIEKKLKRHVELSELPGRKFQAELKKVLNKDLQQFKEKTRRLYNGDK